MPAVSVIIPTYKHRDYVLESIASVRAQTFADWELIVINDGSPDDTHEILQPLASAGVIRYFRQENQGQAVARNRGLAEARGEYVAFLDDDDVWPADSLAWRYEVLTAAPEIGTVCGDHGFFGAEDSPDTAGSMEPREITFESLFEGCPFISPGLALVRTHLLKQVGGLNPKLWGTDDYDLWLRLSQISRIVKYQRTALWYRVHAHNASHNHLRMFHNAWQAISHALDAAKPEDRPYLAKMACRAIYTFHVQALTWEWRQQLLRGEFRKSAASVGGLIRMEGLFTKYDKANVGWILSDLMPGGIRRWFRKPEQAAKAD